MIDLVRVLADAGAAPAAAARAAVVLDRNGSVREAWNALEGVPSVEPTVSDADLLAHPASADRLLSLIGPERSEGPDLARTEQHTSDGGRAESFEHAANPTDARNSPARSELSTDLRALASRSAADARGAGVERVPRYEASRTTSLAAEPA